MFMDTIKSNFTLSFDSWMTDRKINNAGLEFQDDIFAAQNVSSPKYKKTAHQTEAREAGSNTLQHNAIFHTIDLKEYFNEIFGFRYPKEAIHVDYITNGYHIPYRDLKALVTCCKTLSKSLYLLSRFEKLLYNSS